MVSKPRLTRTRAKNCLSGQITSLTRKRNLDIRARQNNPTGKSPKVCPAFQRKIFRLSLRANHYYNFARLTR
jgi:hypothetical protein